MEDRADRKYNNLVDEIVEVLKLLHGGSKESLRHRKIIMKDISYYGDFNRESMDKLFNSTAKEYFNTLIRDSLQNMEGNKRYDLNMTTEI